MVARWLVLEQVLIIGTDSSASVRGHQIVMIRMSLSCFCYCFCLFIIFIICLILFIVIIINSEILSVHALVFPSHVSVYLC